MGREETLDADAACPNLARCSAAAGPGPRERPNHAPPAGTTPRDLIEPSHFLGGKANPDSFSFRDAVASAFDPAYEHIGTLRVQRSQLGQFQSAEKYLSRDPEAQGVLYGLEHGNQTVTLNINNGKTFAPNDDTFDPASNTITWNPNFAIKDTAGPSITPALALLHEQGHATGFTRDRTLSERLQGTADRAYTNLEEKRVITGVENRGAAILGEGRRTTHYGSPVYTGSPTSIAPKTP